MSDRPLLVVAGMGDGAGIGAASAKLFTKAGYSVAMIARNTRDTAQTVADELNKSGGDAAAFPVAAYTPEDIKGAFADIQKRWPNAHLRLALFNIGQTVFKSFLDVTQADVDLAADINVRTAYAFSREVILRQKEQPLNEKGKRGTLVFTGATASVRGNAYTSGFSPGKHALRALSQSLAKEFNKQNIHIAHSIIDGHVGTKYHLDRHDEEWRADPDNKMKPESIAEAYMYLTNQDRSAFTWELDFRAAHEKW